MALPTMAARRAAELCLSTLLDARGRSPACTISEGKAMAENSLFQFDQAERAGLHLHVEGAGKFHVALGFLAVQIHD